MVTMTSMVTMKPMVIWTAILDTLPSVINATYNKQSTGYKQLTSKQCSSVLSQLETKQINGYFRHLLLIPFHET